jgi:hypothetical protein
MDTPFNKPTLATPFKDDEDNELVDIPVRLYSTDTLWAATAANAVQEGHAELYLYGINAQTKGRKVKNKQLKGIMLSHNKLRTWVEQYGEGQEMTKEDSRKEFVRAHLNKISTSMRAIAEAVGLVEE